MTHRLENESGAWLGDATVSITVDDVREGGESIASRQMVVFTGSGEYEGMTAIVWWQPQDTDSRVRGVIVPGSPPLAPPPAEEFPFLPAEE